MAQCPERRTDVGPVLVRVMEDLSEEDARRDGKDFAVITPGLAECVAVPRLGEKPLQRLPENRRPLRQDIQANMSVVSPRMSRTRPP